MQKIFISSQKSENQMAFKSGVGCFHRTLQSQTKSSPHEMLDFYPVCWENEDWNYWLAM